MYTENNTIIMAPASHIYRIAAEIERWPELLPHYRYVTLLRDEGSHRLAKMAATRDGIPVSWTSIQDLDSETFTIRYRHIHGVTRGMTVEWIIEEQNSGTHVRISHYFNPPWPRPFGAFIARHIVGQFFVHNIAEKTLLSIKSYVENMTTATSGVPK